LLEAEVAPNRVAAFEKQYLEETGVRPAVGEYYQKQPNKWGAECRVYLDAPQPTIDALEAAVHEVENHSVAYRADYPYRINTHDLFLELVRAGFRLGVSP
jgi:hypothetical protein